MSEPIWLSHAHMGGHWQKFTQKAFDTNYLVPLGPSVNGTLCCYNYTSTTILGKQYLPLHIKDRWRLHPSS
jgi:hypothetical protein